MLIRDQTKTVCSVQSDLDVHYPEKLQVLSVVMKDLKTGYLASMMK